MGDPINPNSTQLNPNTTPFTLPPGCRFYPSEEQLLCYYLTHKNTISLSNDDHHLFDFDVIKDLDMYGYNPFDLPEITRFPYGCGGKRTHWYCYTARVVKEIGGRRRAGAGYWKRRGRARDVMSREGRVVLGTRTSFVFYLGNSPKSAVRTDWIMNEYALVDHLKAFVLCRVFVKPRLGNSTSDHVLSSCAEESVSAVRHIGIQHDGAVTSDIGEAKAHDDNSADRTNEASRFPMRVGSELDDRVTTGPASVVGFQFPSGIHFNEPVSLSGLTHSGAMFVDSTTAQQFLSILEEDFIELDDLICPLSGIDNSG